ncbi:uncharacterized protein LOC108257901 isoform X2 [Ictalurus punctatus]|uniref:Uncharacterized protein LOC108257901 isoform X2 n=1 Tax=Ictalurus punctatus TaxID=7998 RepID=A0A2D0PZS2_ICTPU|nr:uncharacterized protein LOC108257901 isoform X2 [Ictalurus punctatus]
MRETETIALCVLFLFCSSFTQGEDDSSSPAHLPNFTMPSTSSPPQRSSTAKPEYFSRPTLLSASSEEDIRATADLSANDTLSQSYNDTVNSTVAPGFPIGAAGPTVNTLAPTNSTSVPGNLTESRDGANLSVGDNQTSRASSTTLSDTVTTSLPKGVTKPSTSAPSTRSQTLSASTRPQITTSLLATTTRSRSKSSTVTTKDISAPTTTTTTTTTSSTTTTTIQTTEHSSTPVQAKALAGTPSELNVGDNTEYSNTSMDPLLAGLVSVFVVTAAIVSLLIFLKFRHRNERPEFRRLQDLPMDDMMEDTPLSMYSY